MTHQSLLDSLESKETLIFQLNDCYEMMSSNWRDCNERCKELETELKSKEQFDQLVSSVNQLAKQDQATQTMHMVEPIFTVEVQAPVEVRDGGCQTFGDHA